MDCVAPAPSQLSRVSTLAITECAGLAAMGWCAAHVWTCVQTVDISARRTDVGLCRRPPAAFAICDIGSVDRSHIGESVHRACGRSRDGHALGSSMDGRPPAVSANDFACAPATSHRRADGSFGIHNLKLVGCTPQGPRVTG